MISMRMKVGAGVALLVSAAVWYRSSASDPPKPDPATQYSADSLRITKAAYDSGMVAGLAQVARDTVRAVVYRDRAARATAVATTDHGIADSLAAAARHLTDDAETTGLRTSITRLDSTADAWRAAYDVRTAEAEQWRLAAAQSDSTARAELQARFGALRLYAADTLRRHAIEKVNADLVAAIAKLEQPCRIVWRVPCPSRTVSAAGGAIVTLVVDHIASGSTRSGALP